MKEVLIITPGYFSVTSSHGGAVESLIKLYLGHNGKTKKYKITVYSAAAKKDKNIEKLDGAEIRTVKLFGSKYNFLSIKKRTQHFLSGNAQRPYNDLVLRDLRKRVENRKYGLIIVVNNIEILESVRKFADRDTKVVEYLHNDFLNAQTKNGMRIYNAVDEFWCVSKFIANRVNEIRCDKPKSKVVYNTIDFEKFSSSSLTENEIDALRNDLLIEKDETVFIYTGRIMPGKGVDKLIDAFNALSSRYDNAKLMLVGGSKNQFAEDGYFARIKRLTEENENIRIVGYVNPEILPLYHAISTAQVVPSEINEAFGLSALEGVAMNLPVIYSDDGGLPEIFSNDNLKLRETSVPEIYDKMELIVNRQYSFDVDDERKRIMSKFSNENFFKTVDAEIEKFVSDENITDGDGYE